MASPAQVLLASRDLSFTQPVLSPKNYITKGPSGWTEVFKRDHADAELVKFLGPVGLAPAIDMFVSRRRLAIAERSGKAEKLEWEGITGFLGRTMQVSPLAVPPTAGVAFWAMLLSELDV